MKTAFYHVFFSFLLIGFCSISYGQSENKGDVKNKTDKKPAEKNVRKPTEKVQVNRTKTVRMESDSTKKAKEEGRRIYMKPPERENEAAE